MSKNLQPGLDDYTMTVYGTDFKLAETLKILDKSSHGSFSFYPYPPVYET